MDQGEKLSVTVALQMAQMIRDKVESGQYASSDVISAGLKALQAEEEKQAERLAWVKAQIRASLDNPGPGHSNEEVFAELRARLRAKAAPHSNPARSTSTS